MRALLIHNAGAGDGAPLERGEIVEALGRFGWSVTALDAERATDEHKRMDRKQVIAHLLEATAGQDVALPDLERHRATNVRIGDFGRWVHVDDRPRALEGDVKIRVAPRTVRFLLPAPIQVWPTAGVACGTF